MKAAVVNQQGRLEIWEVPMPRLGPYDVLCKMCYGATCAGTDIHLMDGLHPKPVTFPTILGHESVGRVVEVGPKVKNFRVGDLVSRVGAPAGLLPGLNVNWGGFAEYGVARDHWQMRRDGLGAAQWNSYRVNQVIHPAIDEKTAPMLITWRETLSYTCRIGVDAGKTVLVIGSGANALAIVAHCCNLGATVIAVGSPSREQVFHTFPICGYFSYRSENLEEEVRALMEVLHLPLLDHIIDGVGGADTTNRLLPLLKQDGLFCNYGWNGRRNYGLNPFLAQRSFRVYADGYYELFLLEFATGLRIGELTALQWSDLNPKTGVLNINKQITLANNEMIMSKPKTKQSVRKIVLPKPVVDVLMEYKKNVDSEWMFPSPLSNDRPWNASGLRGRLDLELERAQCPKVRFHDLRHTFATMSLEHGMDVKTLSATLGHVSAATTLDIYSHVTSAMQKQAAVTIEKAISKSDVEYTPEEPKPVARTNFQPYKMNRRKSGTGMVHQIGDELWEGRYSPRNAQGKRISKNVYAKTEAECEAKLAVLIREMKEEIKAEKAILKAQESGITISM